MCVTCTLILCISCYFLQPHCQKWVSACCGRRSVPVVLVDQSGADLGLNLVRLGIYQKSSSTKLQCTFHILFPEKLSLAGRFAVRPIVCPQLTARATVQTGVSSCLLLSPGRSYFEVVVAPFWLLSHCQAYGCGLSGLQPREFWREQGLQNLHSSKREHATTTKTWLSGVKKVCWLSGVKKVCTGLLSEGTVHHHHHCCCCSDWRPSKCVGHNVGTVCVSLLEEGPQTEASWLQRADLLSHQVGRAWGKQFR